MTRLLLCCGILAPLLFIAGDVGMAIAYEGYSYLDQTISELNAIGAPTRNPSVALGVLESVLMIAFGSGVWRVSAGDRRLRVVATALVALGVFGCWSVPYASMQLRGTEQEGPHLVSGAVGAAIVVTAIAFAAASLGNAFRRYSLATIGVMIAFAAWGLRDADRIEAGLATPWVGVIERISFYSWHAWFLVLAVVLLRRVHPRHAALGPA